MRRSTMVVLAVGMLALFPHTLTAQKKQPPKKQPVPKLTADLAFVPADCGGFIHIRVQDLYKSEHVREWRDTITKAGDAALKAFDARFFPRPSTLERITVFFPISSDRYGGGTDDPIFILAFSQPIDKKAFLKFTLPTAKEKKVDGRDLVFDDRAGLVIHFEDDRTLVVTNRVYPFNDRETKPGEAAPEIRRTGLRRVLFEKKRGKGVLTEALNLASSGKPIVAALNRDIVPVQVSRLLVPAELEPLTKFSLATMSIDFEKEGHVDFRAAFPDADHAKAAETAAREGVGMARAFLEKARSDMARDVAGDGPGSLNDLPKAAASLLALGVVNQLEDYLQKLPLKTTGSSLTMSLKMPQGSQTLVTAYASAGAFAWFLYRDSPRASAPSRGGATATKSSSSLSPSGKLSANNLKQIGVAMHSYHAIHNAFPAAAICDKAGKPLLSWRVAILPYIEEAALYNEFKLDQPWDSEHNKKLIPRMPKVYLIPGTKSKPGETHYQVFVDNGAGFDLANGVRLTDITDGTSNTIMCIEAGESVPWSKPADLAYDAKKPLPKFGDFHGNNTFLALFFDGSVRPLRRTIGEASMRALITRAGNDLPDEKDLGD